MKKKTTIAITVILASTLIWYLFIKKYDYVVTFKEKTHPSIIVEAIDIWGNNLGENTDVHTVTKQNSNFSEVTQHINRKDSSYVLNWKIKYINDSLSDIKTYVSEKNNSLKNRFLIPFINSPIEKYAINNLTEFIKGLQKHIKTFSIKINGMGSVPASFCACKSINTTQKKKASEMLAANSEIMAFFMENNIELKGSPYLQITSWDTESEKISFDFCFPIQKSDSITNSKGVFYQEIKSIPALKATYYGNYRYSDRTWDYLLYYAERQNITVEKLPIELFFNDPQQGGNELDWKAEIYMPIVE